jgi:hypothetical protein
MAFFRKGGKRASELLDLCKETYAVRSAEYGDSYIVIGNALSAIFPEGVELKTEEDFRRFHLFAWTVGKLVRYSQNWSSGGHAIFALCGERERIAARCGRNRRPQLGL